MTGCRVANPGFTARLVAWLGREVDLHDWEPYKKVNKHLVFFCRRCECGADQVKQDGPMGDRKWHTVDEALRSSWETRLFNEAAEKGKAA